MFDFLSKYIVPTLVLTFITLIIFDTIYPNVKSENIVYTIIIVSLLLIILLRLGIKKYSKLRNDIKNIKTSIQGKWNEK